VDANQDNMNIRSLVPADFPTTDFFLHLSTGTKFFRNMQFENAINEWEEAAKIRPDAISTMEIMGNVFYQGNLDDVPLVGLFYAISSNCETGVAIIRRDEIQKEVFFKEGWIVTVRTNKVEERLGNYLVKRKLVTQSQVDHMAVEARKKDVKLGKFLVDNSMITERELRELLDFQIKEILCELFAWHDGEFYFFEKEVDEEEVVVNYTPLDIALFAARRSLDVTTFRKMIPHNKIICRIAPQVERAKAKVMEELDANEKFVFSLIDGKRNIDQLIKFGGDDEIFTIDILHRLLLMGLIEKSADSGTYADTEFEELSNLLKMFSAIFSLTMVELKKELGAMAEKVLTKAKESLHQDYGKIFYGLSLDGNFLLDTNKILKNISISYPDPSERLIFVEAFDSLISHILREMQHILGSPVTKNVISEIKKTKDYVASFFPPSPAKNKVVEAFDNIVTRFTSKS
jgi:hypothetical protein